MEHMIGPDPYPYYAQLRARGPVHFFPDRGVYWVVSHRGAMQVLGDRSFGKRIGGQAVSDPGMGFDLNALPPSMLFLDPPDHTRLRSLVNKAFTPAVVEALAPRIRALANALVDEIAGNRETDLVSSFAFPLPAVVIAELMGIPAEDRVQFRAWSEAIALGLDVAQPEAVYAEAEKSTRELAQYFVTLLMKRRQAPKDDLLTRLLAVEEEGDRLGPGELLSMCILLLVAGHETTKNLIANSMLTLLTHPEERAMLGGRSDLLGTAVEELLRYESPVQRTMRVAQQDLELEGVPLPAGSRVVVAIGAANRDPAVFSDPDRLDLSRKENPHLAFGRGIHFCLGAPLARLEGRIALDVLLRRLPMMRLRNETPDWSDNTLIRGLRSLPVLVRD